MQGRFGVVGPSFLGIGESRSTSRSHAIHCARATNE